MREIQATMKSVEDLPDHEAKVLSGAYEVVAAEKDYPGSFPIRRDPVGRMLDGFDFILNNPPGFSVAVAIEFGKETNAGRY